MESIISWLGENYIFIIEIVGTILGFAYMYYEYKAKFALWPIGIVWSLCYISIFWIQGFYAWALTWFYYLFANIYGLFEWKNEEKRQGDYKITRMKKSWRWPVVVVSIALTIPILFFVKRFNPYVTVPLTTEALFILISESVSTSLGIVGMYFLAKKVAEQWIFWIVVNALYLVVNIYIRDWPLSVFYVAYTAMSVMGLVRWQRDAAEQQS
ncbi:MAG: nicotinamide mononucleotide transporter [Bacteroidales bacterium]|nr:nicotinamide mononucleotide transporter [Bacteroidales bacterium]